MQNGFFAKIFVPSRITAYDTRKGSFARALVRGKAPFLAAVCQKAAAAAAKKSDARVFCE